MSKLYLNPAARIPYLASASGHDMLPAASEAIVEPSEAFHADFYEQLWGTNVRSGAWIKLYTATPSQLAAMLDALPGWFLAPQISTDELRNLGTFEGYPSSELKNGAALDTGEAGWTGTANESASTLTPLGGAAMRTNLIPNPGFEVGTNKWEAANGGIGEAVTAAAHSGEKGCLVKTKGENTSEGIRTLVASSLRIPIQPNTTYTFSFYMRAASAEHIGKKVRFIGREFHGEEATVVHETVSQLNGLLEGWTRYSITFTTSATSTSAYFWILVAEVKVMEWHIDDVLLEVGEPAGEYFPTPLQLSNGLTTGARAAVLDGVNDYINTRWTPRTNLIPKPLSIWDLGFTREVTTVLNSAGPRGWANYAQVTGKGGSGQQQNVRPGTSNKLAPVLPEQQVTFRANFDSIAGLSNGLITIALAWATAAGAFITSNSKVVSKAGLVEFTATAPAESAWVEPAVSIQVNTGLTATVSVEWTEPIAEFGAAISSAGYFPSAAQIASGEAVYSGTSGNSVVDIGWAPRSSTRTFVGMAEFATYPAEPAALFSGEDANAPVLQVTSTGGMIYYVYVGSPNQNMSWPAATFPSGAPFMWALVHDGPGRQAELFVNGVSKGVKAWSESYTGFQPAWESGPMRLGTYLLTQWVKGKMLPFAIYPRKLSSAEIAALYSP